MRNTHKILQRKPPIQLNQKNILRKNVEQIVDIIAEWKLAIGLEARAALRPHQEQRRTRNVFPPHHEIRAELPEIEIRIGKRIIRRTV